MVTQTLQGREQAFYRSVTGVTSGTWEQNILDAWEAMGCGKKEGGEGK